MRSGKILFLLLIFVGFSSPLISQTFRFDFGNGPAVEGYTKISTNSWYSAATGYGFEPSAVLQAVARKTGLGVKKDFISATKPFFFSVKLPEGNYNVRILLGDAEGSSATTIRAENRRLFYSHLVTAKGQFATAELSIHIRDSLIRDQAGNRIGSVKLKPREITYPNWDDKLSLEFNDTAIKVCAIEIMPEPKVTTVFLAGNSTVVDQDKEPWAAWGQMFPSFFQPGTVCIANYAESGETLKAFRGERRLQKLLSMAKPGDYLFIEFAHNDQKPGGSFLDPFTTYAATLKEWIAEARTHRLKPVLVTSMHRRSFDSTGHIINTLLDYPEAMRQTAKSENVPLVDLNAMSKELYETWGKEKSLKAFVHFPANSFPGQTQELKDDTHFTTYGAYELARCIVQALKDQHWELAKYFRKDIPYFDPTQPDEWESWYWPLSPSLSVQKPDGN
jgi:lysophospholipase L1-like esterase